MFRAPFFCFMCCLIVKEETFCAKPNPNVPKSSHGKSQQLNKALPGTHQPRVRLNNGAVIYGQINKTVDENKTYYSFRGIPYAEPPVGDLRFRNPVPLRGNFSETIYYAYRDGSPCIQGGFNPEGSEDCLYINVYTPRYPGSNSTGLLPVMVWIYGGGFLWGTNNYQSYGPDFLLDEGVMVVTINYRLGIYGFLSTEDEASPGNYGIRDQILALVWVQENIEAFGGNPKQVTIFGESAGAASVSYLTQTNLTTGLFNGSIMESGTSFCLWALTRNPRDTAIAVAKILNIQTNTSQSIVDGLRKANTAQLNGAQSLITILEVALKGILNGLPFGPTVEPYYPHTVITNESYTQISQGFVSRVPSIVGINSNEGAFFAQGIDYIRIALVINDVGGSALVPASLNIKDSATAAKVNSIIKRKYFDNTPIAISSTETIVKYMGDDQFNRPIVEYVKQLSKVSNVYFYKFSYEGSQNRTIKGVSHSEELRYLWYMPGQNNTPTTPTDILTRKRMCKLWTNFAVTGNPTPKQDPLLENIRWPVANTKAGNVTYLNINTNLTIKENPFEKAVLFWQRIFNEFGVAPCSTY